MHTSDKTEAHDMGPDGPNIIQTSPGKFEAVPHEKKLPLMECFGPTVQGEGHVIGQQTYFLRFGLCDYKCQMCDSMHAVDATSVHANANWLTQEGIVEKFLDFRASRGSPTTNWVTFSGGNPCIHDLSKVVEDLRRAGMRIAVETQGTFAPDWLQMCDVITVSPKGPGMGEKFEADKFQHFIYKFRFHFGLNIKVVIFDVRDLEFAKGVMEMTQKVCDPPPAFYLSLGNPFPPGKEFDISDDSLRNLLIHNYLQLLEDVMVDPMLCRTRFLPQWHVLLWGNKKGV